MPIPDRQMMRLQFSATVPKHKSEPHLNDDARDARPYRGLYAVSDGATESYNSRLWARTLVTRFLARTEVDDAWLRAAVVEYAGHFNRDSMSWSAQAAFDRGSFATLLGVQITAAGSKARVTAIGDSLAVLASDGDFISSFPYDDPEEFRRAPVLISTLHERNAPLLKSGNMVRATIDWDLHRLRAPQILLMTDALGAWLLGSPDDRLATLLTLPSRASFAALVDAERSAGRMRRDDTTLLIIG